MNLVFTSPYSLSPGALASMLERCYADLLRADPDHWLPEQAKWHRFDRDVFDSPQTVGACVFLSQCDEELAGFASFDPRPQPEYGFIGHNLILPEFQGRGFGQAQVGEILRRFHTLGIKTARVTTLDHPFFIPAQRMYTTCGFQETNRYLWNRNPTLQIIQYERLV